MNRKRSGFLSMAIGLFIILLAVAVWQYANFGQKAYAPSMESDQAGNEHPGWKTYKDDQYAFSLQYPADFTLRDETDGNLSLNVPVGNYFKTVITSEATMIIFNPSLCGPTEAQNAIVHPSVVSNAGSFKKVTYSDAGAGQLYESTQYTLTGNNLCYEVGFLIHSANGGASMFTDDPAKIAADDAENASDKTAFINLMDQIVSTFTFNH
jgi:hypothetical protein